MHDGHRTSLRVDLERLLHVTSKICDSLSSERESVPFFRYGPKRPFCAVISSPDSGSAPTTRGRLSSCSAVSSSSVSTDIERNSDAVRGLGAVSFFAPRLGLGASTTSPVLSSTAASSDTGSFSCT